MRALLHYPTAQQLVLKPSFTFGLATRVMSPPSNYSDKRLAGPGASHVSAAIEDGIDLASLSPCGLLCRWRCRHGNPPCNVTRAGLKQRGRTLAGLVRASSFCATPLSHGCHASNSPGCGGRYGDIQTSFAAPVCFDGFGVLGRTNWQRCFELLRCPYASDH